MTEHFRAHKVTIDGHLFDSRSEARRYTELCLMRSAGLIGELQVHPELILIPAYEGKPAVRYTADFSYMDLEHCVLVTEDVKPFKRNAKGERVPYLTRDFVLRWKLAQYNYRARKFEIVEA